MDSDLNLLNDLLVKAVHNPSLIGNIVQMALQNQNSAFKCQKISEVIINNIYQARPEDKIYAFFLLDSLMRYLGSSYMIHFSAHIIGLFINSYRTMTDLVKRQTLVFLRKKWIQYFPPYILDRLDDEMSKLDPYGYKMLNESQTQNIGEKRKPSLAFDDNSMAKNYRADFQAGRNVPPMNIYNPRGKAAIPDFNFPRMGIPQRMFQPFNFPPPNFNNTPLNSTNPAPNVYNPQRMAPPQMMPNTMAPSYSNLGKISESYFSKPIVKNKENITKLQRFVAPKNVESFPNLSHVLNSITSMNLSLNNYSHAAFSRFNKEEVDKLYAGTLCDKCGLRFKDSNSQEFRDHMQLHENKKDIQLFKRKYTRHYTDWVKVPIIECKGTWIETKLSEVPTFDDHAKNICGVCYEGFDIKFDGQDTHMLQNAQLVDGSAYHPICVSDINRVYANPEESSSTEERSLRIFME